MNKFVFYSTILIVLLARLALGLTLLNFVWTFSHSHAIILFVTYVTLALGESNLRMLMKEIK